MAKSTVKTAKKKAVRKDDEITKFLKNNGFSVEGMELELDDLLRISLFAKVGYDALKASLDAKGNEEDADNLAKDVLKAGKKSVDKLLKFAQKVDATQKRLEKKQSKKGRK